MSWGFVYILWNESMPGLYKIGRTSRSPSARAEELSAASGVPTTFNLLCYAESNNHEQLEADIHAHYASGRVNPAREFFQIESLRDAMAFLIARSWSFCMKSDEAMLESGEMKFIGEFDLQEFINQVRKSHHEARSVIREASK